MVAGLGTLGALLVLGVPTAVIPNPFFVRMTPTDAVNVLTLVASAPLFGLLAATYVADPGRSRADIHASDPGTRIALGGIAAYLAIGCPICNKILVLALGASGALTIFGPLQPLFGIASLALLALTLRWRLRMRVRGCVRCAREASAQHVQVW